MIYVSYVECKIKRQDSIAEMRILNRRNYTIAIIVIGILLGGIYVYVANEMAVGLTSAERKELDRNPSEYGLNYETVTFAPRDGELRLEGWYIANDDGPVILFVHGINNNRAEDGDFLKMALELHEHGYGAMLFDLRAHGESEGEFASGGFFEKQDVLGAFDFLIERGIASNRIGLMSYSMGAATSLQAVAKEPRIQAGIFDSPYADVADLIAQETARNTPFPQWLVPVFIPGMRAIMQVQNGIDINEIVPEESVQQLEFPLLLIHGTADTRILPEHGIRIHEATKVKSNFWLVDDAEHADSFNVVPGEYLNRMVEYFDLRFGRN